MPERLPAFALEATRPPTSRRNTLVWSVLLCAVACATPTPDGDPTPISPTDATGSDTLTSNQATSTLSSATGSTAHTASTDGTRDTSTATPTNAGTGQTSAEQMSALTTSAGAPSASTATAANDSESSSAAPTGVTNQFENSTASDATASSDATATTSPTDSSGALLSKDQTVRVMAFGDSITATGCWREKFLLKVNAGGYDVDMVGSTKEKQCNETDVDNEGHSGKLITEEKNNVAAWAQANPADVVLFHWGTNDVWKSAPITDDYVNEILAAYTTAVEGLRGANPDVIVIVAQIIALNPSDGGCAACPGNVQKLNAAIPAWASAQTSANSPVLVADLWTGFDTAVGTNDGAHPYTDAGVEHMASRWYDAFVALF